MNSPSGTKFSALDYYLLTSLIFLFGTIAEFACVLLVSRTLDENKPALRHSIDDKKDGIDLSEIKPNNQKQSSSENENAITNLWGLRNSENTERKTVPKTGLYKKMNITSKIDIMAFFYFHIWVYHF